jgi:colicin import membrane protein
MTENVLLQPFNPIMAEIEKIKAHDQSLTFDYESIEGNKAARSHVFTLRKVKARVSDAHKSAKADALEVCRVLDGYKRDLTSAVDAIIERHDAPLREIEERETRKKAEEAARIEAERMRAENQRLAEMEAKRKALDEQERALREREESIKRQEREAQIARDAELRERERAERRIVEERERAENEKREAVARVEREAKEREAAIERERVRVANEKATADRIKAEEDARRAANIKHRSAVNRAAADAIIKCGATEDVAKAIVSAIAKNQVPAVTINY